MVTELRLKMCSTQAGTQVSERYFTNPLKLGFPRTYGKRRKVVLMMASAGVLKGDCFDYKIRLEENSCAELTEQSYTKLFQMGTDGQAQKKVEITVEQGASFYYKPCALIPFKNSCFCGETVVYLEKDSEFAYCDILSAGRIAMGEKFAFRKYQNKTRIYIDHTLSMMDACQLEPKKYDYTNPVYFGDYTHQGCFYYYGKDEKLEQLLQTACELQQKATHMYCGVSQAKRGVCIRGLANSAQDLEEYFGQMAKLTGMEAE